MPIYFRGKKKVNGCSKRIDLDNIFKKVLWKKKKIIFFVCKVLYFL